LPLKPLKFVLPPLRRESYCWKCRGIANASGYCFRRGGKERRVPSVAVVVTNLGCKQRWGWSSQLETTLLMADDGVLLLSTWINFAVIFLMNREPAVRGRDDVMQRWWFARDAAGVGWAADAREETYGCRCTAARGVGGTQCYNNGLFFGSFFFV
jgi:hypothetical protein